MLMQKTNCLVRIYMVEGFDFARRDIGSDSDPYLILKCGKKTYNEQENYQLDEPNPKFFKHYDFDVEFPGAPPLYIDAYDYDDLFGDDLIGSTYIDLDDRFFSAEWRSIKHKPIEYRSLTIPSSANNQGTVKLFLEMYPNKEMLDVVPFDIAPRPVKEYEVRLVVWDTKDVVAMDIEGTSDVFFKCFFDNKRPKETDTHFRCNNGKASFNYRLLFKFKAPADYYTLTLQGWDRDFFASNDLIGEAQLNLRPLFEDVIETEKQMGLTKDYYEGYLKDVMPPGSIEKFHDEDSFWVKLMGPDEKTGETKCNGLARFSITILPMQEYFLLLTLLVLS